MKKVFLGIHDIGFERARLYIKAGTGGNVDLFPDDKGAIIVEIGADHDKFYKVVAVLVHEAMEITMSRLGFSYSQSAAMNQSTASYVFMMNHEQFTECTERAGEFVASAMPALEREWKSWQLRAKKRASAKRP